MRQFTFPHPTIALVPGLLLAAATAFAAELPNFANLVENNAPTIVEITASFRAGRVLPDGDPEQRPELPEFQRRGAVGSGFLVSADGFVITNNHVIENATGIQVHLNDRRVFDAEIIGRDEPSDLALLKIEAGDLPHVEFGDSDALRVGEWVLAIGSPFGLEFSAAAGIVSAKGRSVPGRSSFNYMSFIQTDVAINQGNSGGPLFNLHGQVVGINSRILSSTGGSNGISFAIPGNVALNIVSQLRETGTVERGLLGVRMREVSHALAEVFGMDRPRGAFVDGVQPGSPANEAGIRNEDIIIEFNGHPIEYFTDLPFFVGQYRPGTVAGLTLIRNGELLDRTVELGSSPTNTAPSPRPATTRYRTLGLSVGQPGLEAEAPRTGGVHITEVNPGPGREAGLRVGDVIVSLNRREIRSPQDFSEVVGSLPESGFIPIRILREGQGTTIVLELSR